MNQHDAQVDKLKQLTINWAQAQPKVAGFVGAFIHNYNDAQDIIQDVAKAAVETIDTYDPARPFGPWILGVARFKVIDHLRRHGKDRHIFDNDAIDRLTDAYQGNDNQLDDMKAALAHCMQSVGERNRKALNLRYVEDAKPAKIADELGMSAGATRVLLHRVRQALAECVERRLAEQNSGVGS